MKLSQAKKFAKLQAQVLTAQAAVVLIREELIESLGDHLCGSGKGPSLEMLQNFRRLELIEKVARRNLAKFIVGLVEKALKNRSL